VAVEIHPSACVEQGAQLADGVRIGAFAYIGAQVSLGAGCVVHPHASIDGLTTMGEDCEVFPYAYIGGRTQDKKWSGDVAPVHIGARNTFREFTSVHPATFADKCTQIGADNLFCCYAHIGHECTVGDHCIFSNNATLGGHVVVGDHVVIGGLTAVHQFCRIGGGAMIGGCCKVLQDICPNMLAEGYPATHRTINKVGMRRRGFSEDEVQLAARLYKLVFRRGLNRLQAVEALTQHPNADAPLVRQLHAFLSASERGIA
jgi:UDP-N-acetylglucosamine acyltransferase